MKIIICILLLFLNIYGGEWQTYYEESGYKKTPRYAETIAFCKKLAGASSMVQYSTFGKSPQGRDLPLLIVDKDGNFTPKKVKNSGRAIVLIEAGIHAGEIDGKDAGLMLIRDIVIHGKYPRILDNVTLLFIPIFSVDGHEKFGPYKRINQNGPDEMGWRVTAQNFNLNRDFMKADAPEMQYWLKLFQDWLPDFFIDSHVTDGADYQYTVTYSIEIHGNMPPQITEWTKNTYLPSFKKMMRQSGFPVFPYVAFVEKHNPQSGVVSWVCIPRLSHGYTALQNRPGLLLETHMLKDYKTRVEGTYQAFLNTIRILNKEYKNVIKANIESDLCVSSPGFRDSLFTLDFQRTADTIMIDYLGYQRIIRKSDVSGTDWIFYSDKKTNEKIPFYYKQIPEKQVKLPQAYVIPAEWKQIIQRLNWHGIKYSLLKDSSAFEVELYQFDDVSWSIAPYEGRFFPEYSYQKISKTVTYPAGSVYIPIGQRTAPVIAHLLEPDAPDALLNWGFFNIIFEYKEYAELYLLEIMARQMLEKDEKLEQEFLQKLDSDSLFAASPRERLYFFYRHSPYWNDEYNVYPVGRVIKAVNSF